MTKIKIDTNRFALLHYLRALEMREMMSKRDEDVEVDLELEEEPLPEEDW